MTQLDDHGARILAFIERYQEMHHRSPTFEEIGVAVGIPSKDHVSRDLNRLRKQGYLTFTPRVGRSIVLLKNKRSRSNGTEGIVPLPVVGTIQTREPLPEPEPEIPPLDWVTIGRDLVGDDRDVYVLRVKGDSMIDALVNDGDLVVLRRKESARNGEMVAVWDKATGATSLKYYHRENGHVRLQPANPKLKPLHVNPSDVEIQGQVLAIVRKASEPVASN
jgi:repressor LexA